MNQTKPATATIFEGAAAMQQQHLHNFENNAMTVLLCGPPDDASPDPAFMEAPAAAAGVGRTEAAPASNFRKRVNSR
jgi:hypothetical protein